MSNNYENKYNLSPIIQLLNPDNTISAHRMLAHAIGMTETIIYSSLISKQTYYLNNNMLHKSKSYSPFQKCGIIKQVLWTFN